MNIEEKVKDIVAGIVGADPGEIGPESCLMKDLGADSLDCVEVTIKVEREFNINITDEEYDNLKTVRDYVELIKSKVA